MDAGAATTDTAAVLPSRPADPRWSEVRRPFWHVVRAGTSLGWLLLLAAVLLTGERASSVDSLLSAAADGDVAEVRVSGGLPPGARGYAVAQLRWRDGVVDHVAQIVEANPRRVGVRARAGTEERRVVTTDAATYVDARTQGVRVTRGGGALLPNGLGPWSVPGWVVWGVLALAGATLYLLVGGPRPWRATRWAWFWLLALAPPIGVPAFLVLSGPIPRLSRPRPGARLLTGGWAFLLAALLLKPLLQG